MLDFQQKRKFRSIVYHRVTLGILAVVVLIILHSTWVVYKKKKESDLMKNVSLEHLTELHDRNDELQEKIDKLATVSGVEEEIRSKFSVAKDGENMVVVVHGEDSKPAVATTSISFWQKVKEFFVGR